MYAEGTVKELKPASLDSMSSAGTALGGSSTGVDPRAARLAKLGGAVAGPTDGESKKVYIYFI
jgi:hypothetical protein